MSEVTSEQLKTMREKAIAATEMETNKLAVINLNKPPITVKHSELKRVSNSPYRSECPICKKGVLLMQRDQKTFKLLNKDRCILCGQLVIYEEINEIVKQQVEFPVKLTLKPEVIRGMNKQQYKASMRWLRTAQRKMNKIYHRRCMNKIRQLPRELTGMIDLVAVEKDMKKQGLMREFICLC